MMTSPGPLPPEVPPRYLRRPLRSSSSDTMPSFYHPCVKNIDQVKQLLVKYVGKEGAFIVRNSFSIPGSFTASVMHGEGIKHFNILKNGAYFFVQEQRFHSIEEVVDYFSSHEVPNQEGVKHVMLRYPIPCNCLPAHSPPSTPLSSRSDLSSIMDLGHSASASSAATLPANMQMFPQGGDSSSSIDDSEGMPTSLAPRPKSSPGDVLPRKGKVGWLSSILRGKSAAIKENKHSRRHTRTDMERGPDIDNRPPCPLPSATHQEITNPANYETVRDEDENRLPELIQMLRATSEQGTEKCECGLSLDESELPGGWSMHISHDDKTRGRLFFMGPRGETSWNLPLEVSLTLCADDQDRIRNVKAKCDDLQELHRRNQRVNAQGAAQVETNSHSSSSMGSRQHQNGSFVAGEFNTGFISEDGASSVHMNGGPQSFTNGRPPLQHNEYTGSTTGESPAMSSASLSYPTSY